MADDLTLPLRDRIRDPKAIAADPFGTVRELAIAANRELATGSHGAAVQSLILRALDMRDRFGSAAPVLDSLIRQRGLFPYLDPDALGLADLLAYEAHRPEGIDEVIFHRAQAEVYRLLLDGQNVVLSAPTSFGKSLIVDAMIAS